VFQTRSRLGGRADPGGEGRKIDEQTGAGEEPDTATHSTKKETKWHKTSN